MEDEELLEGEQTSLPSSYEEHEFTEHDGDIVAYLNSAWSSSAGYYTGIDPVTSLVLNFYNGSIPDEYRQITNPLTGEVIETHYSTARIGWTKRAIDQLTDEVVTNLFQTSEFFSIAPTLGSENATAVCEKLVTMLLHNAGFEGFVEDVVRTYFLMGEVGVYVDWADEDATTLFLARLPYKNIRHLPVHVHTDKAVLSYTQYMTKYDLLNTPDGFYFNVNKLDEPEGNQIPRSAEPTPGSYSGPMGDEFLVTTSYIPEMTIDGKTYLNSVAVIAHKEFLIRFETGLTHEEFMSRPHIRACREHYVDAVWGPVQIGQSIAHQAIDLELAGFVVHNLLLDNAKQTVHPPREYDPGDVALKAYMSVNPLTAFAPGMLVPTNSNRPTNLQPIIGKENLLQTGMAIIQRLEQQYLMTIGIPDFGGGVASDDQRVAATTRSIQANRAALRTKAIVKDVNRQVVMPIVYRTYKLVAAGFNDGNLIDLASQVAPIETKLAMLGGERAPNLTPERFSMTVYESPTARSERIQAMQQLLGTIPTLLQGYPTLLQEAGIEIPRMVRQLMRDLGIEASMPMTPAVLQAPPQGDPNASTGMEGQPGNAVPGAPPASGNQQPEGLPNGQPLPGGVQ